MKSYDDPAKEKAREKELAFIQKNLAWQLRKPERIRVACLESAQLLEIKQVFDHLNIPRSNITVIERSKEVAKQIKSQDSEINVANCTDLEFFESYHGDSFHIISLDYTGNKHPNIGSTLEHITAKQLLKQESILLINTYAAQEAKKQQDYLKYRANLNFDLNDKLVNTFINSDQTSLAFNLHLFNGMEKEQELNESRDSFTKEIIRILSLGLSAKELIVGENFDFILCHPQADAIIKNMEKVLKEHNITRSHVYALEMAFHRDAMTKYIGMLLGIDHKTAYVTVEQLLVILGKSYLIRNLERYKYISNSGSPMEMDIFNVTRDDKTIKKLIPFISFRESNNGKLLTINDRFGIRKFLKIMSKYFEDFQKGPGKYAAGEISERIFLGSAAKMLKK